MKAVRFLSVVVFVLSMGAVNAHAQVATHMGQAASKHVTLELVSGMPGGCGPSLYAFNRVMPDGTASVFRIPDKEVLVVTDVDWQFENPGAAGTFQTLRLIIENLADPYVNRSAFDSTIMLGKHGKGGTSEHMTSGFVVSSRARICPDVFPMPTTLVHLLIRGYLTPDK